jgi:hypothetical protein
VVTRPIALALIFSVTNSARHEPKAKNQSPTTLSIGTRLLLAASGDCDREPLAVIYLATRPVGRAGHDAWKATGCASIAVGFIAFTAQTPTDLLVGGN